MLLSASTPGMSDTAAYVRQVSHDELRNLINSNAIGIGTIQNDLFTIMDQCQSANWDGYNALPVIEESIITTQKLLECLPFRQSPTSVGIEPDGHVTLEWYRSPRHLLSISIDPNGKLHYAALFGPNRASGTEVFFDEVPETILALIQRVRQNA